jgi:hypothetical protein
MTKIIMDITQDDIDTQNQTESTNVSIKPPYLGSKEARSDIGHDVS